MTRTMQLRRKFDSTRNVTSAVAQAIHASHRSSGNVDPRPDGGTGGGTVSPFSPPNASG